jgi:hypothetical protein
MEPRRAIRTYCLLPTRIYLIFLIINILLAHVASAVNSPIKPNIILILTDDLGPGEVNVS